MAARIVEGIFTCTKRWALESALLAAGHRWPKRPTVERTPMSGAENVCRILCWLDRRDDPHGRLYGVSASEIELAAQWTGDPGVLVDSLVATGWIVKDTEGLRWHDYAALNRLTITDRLKKRGKRGDKTGDSGMFSGDKVGDRKGDKPAKTRDRTGDNMGDRGTKTGASGYGSGDSFRKESPGPEEERPLAPGGARAQEAIPEPARTPANAGTLPTLDPRLWWDPVLRKITVRPGCEAPPKIPSTGGAP